jgi:hypothetical protein
MTPVKASHVIEQVGDNTLKVVTMKLSDRLVISAQASVGACAKVSRSVDTFVGLYGFKAPNYSKSREPLFGKILCTYNSDTMSKGHLGRYLLLRIQYTHSARMLAAGSILLCLQMKWRGKLDHATGD